MVREMSVRRFCGKALASGLLEVVRGRVWWPGGVAGWPCRAERGGYGCFEVGVDRASALSACAVRLSFSSMFPR